jgi:hypothetical protein
MIIINYPEPDFKLKTEKGKDYIFDLYRKTWLLLTEEEWVRQNFIAFLVKDLQYPASLIAVEKLIMLGELKKRFDILVYNQATKPWLMVECKAPSIPLNEAVLQQVLRYNISMPVTYLVITNGQHTLVFEKKDRTLMPLHAMPRWPVSAL